MDQDIYVIFAGTALNSFIFASTPHTKIERARTILSRTLYLTVITE
jgi:hypothetical protein